MSLVLGPFPSQETRPLLCRSPGPKRACRQDSHRIVGVLAALRALGNGLDVPVDFGLSDGITARLVILDRPLLLGTNNLTQVVHACVSAWFVRQNYRWPHENDAERYIYSRYRKEKESFPAIHVF